MSDKCVICDQPAIGTSLNGFGQPVPRCADCMPATAELTRLRAVAHAANDVFLAFARAEQLADDDNMVTALSALGAALDGYDNLRESCQT